MWRSISMPRWWLRARTDGKPVFYGDASRREILRQVGGGAARAFVVTPDAPIAAERMVRAIRMAWPNAAIYARALDAAHARRLVAAGASHVVPEALEGSLQLAGRVLAGSGLPDDAIDARLAVHRGAEIRRLTGDAPRREERRISGRRAPGRCGRRGWSR